MSYLQFAGGECYPLSYMYLYTYLGTYLHVKGLGFFLD